MPDSWPGEAVVDASVAAKAFFWEEGSELAREALESGLIVLAPDLIFIELASVAAKRHRLGLSTRDEASDAVRAARELVDFAVPMAALADRAFDLAAEHGFSAYDASYLALAEVRGLTVLTADVRLVRRAHGAKLGGLVLQLI